MIKGGFVYIMANNRPTLYTGVTNNLAKRIYQHKNKVGSWFTSTYNLNKLVYFEYFDTIEQAIIREKQIKDMNRKDKLLLIQKINPAFKDLHNKILDVSLR
ncbi:endonuclease [Candidatus Roizmanbacteria bacterium CG_4_10_14_0_8_um_filter_33_9]|uniref:Endonuclease n=1 Tax=Candidatus Roizmanbacteria bacterium CG_4_10_14_0_8_um_filter_33_9 TaxID=1974826 RepID=A0A2M7QKX6_9BACT|nr:MAG: endonuclease [Candidatus Roizmanbacteria bacterium CG_4_10_14_0_8_um_filter_33_9]